MASDAVTARAPLVEIFSSIQGEGRFAGQRMVFVRTGVCPIRCSYCDTPHSHVAAPSFRFRVAGELRSEANPVAAARAAAIVREVEPRPLSLSVTGGEPLLVPQFIAALAAELGIQRPIHLETAALHPDRLAECLPALAHVSADYKLPGTLASGDYRTEHRACIALAVEAGVTVDVKLVLTSAVTDAAVADAFADLTAFRAAVLIVLQPVTPFGAVTERVDAVRVQRLADRAEDCGFSVRVLTQMHKMLGAE